jgi:hypothetical protein
MNVCPVQGGGNWRTFECKLPAANPPGSAYTYAIHHGRILACVHFRFTA